MDIYIIMVDFFVYVGACVCVSMHVRLLVHVGSLGMFVSLFTHTAYLTI